MQRSWLTLIITAAVIALLTVLVVLQYRWLAEASEAERDRLQRRVETDTKNLADEFNREIQSAYFNFQIADGITSPASQKDFNDRLEFWRGRTAFPDLITSFVFVPAAKDESPLQYSAERKEFEPVEAAADLQQIIDRVRQTDSPPTVLDEFSSLIAPIMKKEMPVERIVIRSETGDQTSMRAALGERSGNLIIRLDPAVIRDQMLPALKKKYFPEGDFNVSAAGAEGSLKYGRARAAGEPDATANLFELSPENFVFFANRELLPARIPTPGQATRVARVESQLMTRVEAPPTSSRANTSAVTIELNDANRPRTTLVASRSDKPVWTLSVYHTAGSVDAFVNAQWYKSFGIGLGIYLLLVFSIIAIVLSSLRSKRFAQRQIDFVSSVSHEFRTPLAVIYSAGENLADGVAADDAQIQKYGQMIKAEGRKLSAMVEQILEFAGSRSGKRKYTFAETDLAAVAAKALDECRPMLEEERFEIETDLTSIHPAVADPKAVTAAVKNLIANSMKYSNGNRWIKLSATESNVAVAISLQDRGIGIAPADLKHIFEPFYRARSVVDAQIHGSGLGLSLVKDIASAHGGRVYAESTPGLGSKFTIEIPRSTPGV